MRIEENNTQELNCFKGRKKSISDINNKRKSKLKALENSSNNSAKSQDTEKQCAVELMLYDLMNSYSFINIDNRHLYYYHKREGCWKLIPTNLADIELRLMLTKRWIKSINSSNLSELYKWLLIESPTKDIHVFNTGYDYLNFKDRAFNWKTKETTKDRRDLYFSYSLAVDYPKDKESSGEFEAFLDDIFGSDKETKKEFSKFVGLALSDIRNLKYIIHLYGQSNTGKSTALNAIKNVVGAKACASLSFSQLSQEFYLSSLHGCRLNIS